MLGVLFNYSSCEKKKLHSFTYSAVRSCQLSHRKELYYFRPDFSVTKVEYYSSGANWIGLLPTQHPQYTSLLIPPFEVMHFARFTLTSKPTQILAQSEQNSQVYLHIQQRLLLRLINNDILQHYGFGEGYFGTYST